MSSPILFAGRLGVASVVMLVSGPVLALTGLVQPEAGYSLASMSGIASALASGIAIVALIRRDRPRSLYGWVGVIGAFITTFVTMAYTQRRDASEHWDATTSRDAPPAFVAAEVPPVAGAEVIDPLILDAPVSDVFARVGAAAREAGWDVTNEDAERRHLEATVREGVFGFVHDVAIDVRVTTSSAAVVQARARSRTPQPDGGSNARMLRAMFDAVSAR